MKWREFQAEMWTQREQQMEKKLSIEKKRTFIFFANMLLEKNIPVNLLQPETKLEHSESVLAMYNKTKLQPVGKSMIKMRNPRNHKLYLQV